MAGVSKHTGTLLQITGDKAIDRKLKTLSKTVQSSVAKPAVRKLLQVVAKAQKAAAPMAKLKKTIGYSLKAKGQEVVAKAGVAVGKKMAPKATEKPRKRGGVGLSSRNAHWFVLGTQMRTTGYKRAGYKRTEKVRTKHPVANRGRIEGHAFIKQATQAAWPQAVQAAGDVARQKLAEAVSKT